MIASTSTPARVLKPCLVCDAQNVCALTKLGTVLKDHMLHLIRETGVLTDHLIRNLCISLIKSTVHNFGVQSSAICNSCSIFLVLNVEKYQKSFL